jgi:hypothetical protein
VEDNQWLELLHSFTSVKDLVLSKKSFRLVAPSLQEPGEGSIAEVLPALKTLFLQGTQPSRPDKEAIRKFIATRKLSDCHISVHHGDGPGSADNSWEDGNQ